MTSEAEGGGPSGPWELRDHLGPEDRKRLRDVAEASIQAGLETGRALDPDPGSYPQGLMAQGATFVTLELEGRLRGCVGSFEASRSLLEDVARNAFAAAFRDHRFSPLSRDELGRLDIHISLLTPLVPLAVESREELIRILRPGVDGLLMEDPPHRATFLPQVWEALPEPDDFLEELFRKAGLPPGHWSRSLTFSRYQVEGF
jgi:AmmeMemoRadiSam system protein A